MAAVSDCLFVEQAIGYQFRNKKLLQEALTAAGADRDGHDGNRQLASIGQAALRLAIADSGYMELMPRGQTGEVQSLLDSKSHLASAATQLGIASCIKLCPKSGEASNYVVALAMRAIIGATWKDTDSRDIVRAVVQRLSPLVNLCGNSSTVSSPPVLQSVDDSVDIQRLLSPRAASLVGLCDPLFNLTVPSGLQYDESTGESILYVAGHNTAQYHSGLDNNPEDLQFKNPDPITWDPTIATFDGTFATGSGDPQTTPSSNSSNRSVESIYAGHKRTHDDSIPSTSASSIETVPCNPKRRRINSLSSDEEAFEDYVAMENRRCTNYGVSEPGNTYLTRGILDDTMAISKERGNSLFRLLLGLCSASSIVALRAALIAIRGVDISLQPPEADLSVLGRLSAIDASENQITSLTMIKRCHVLKLWEHSCAHRASYDGWVSMNAGLENTPKKPGNPQNHEKSLATTAVMNCVFPELTKLSDGYTSKYNKIKRLLSLGQKLSMLTQKFGQGILGLVQCYEHDAHKKSFPYLSDQRLCSMAVADLEKFLPILDRSQGNLLREFSEAANPMVRHMLRGTVKGSQIFRLEAIDPEEILRLPKGSRALLSMLGESS